MAVILTGFPLFMSCVFSLTAFNILSVQLSTPQDVSTIFSLKLNRGKYSLPEHT